MRCPRCQHDNSERANFCQECGQRLRVRCPSCGFEAALAQAGGSAEPLSVADRMAEIAADITEETGVLVALAPFVVEGAGRT